MTMAVSSEAQLLAPDTLVHLYELDATDIGGSIFRFCSSVDARLDINSLTALGTTATCITDLPHLLTTGDAIRITGADQQEYNGDHTVVVLTAQSFTYSIIQPTTTPATGQFLTIYRLNHRTSFDNNEYIPIEIEVTGFEWNGQGTSLPTPRVVVSNKYKLLLSAVLSLDDLRGAKFTRIRTFKKYLDDGISPDPLMYFPKEVFFVNRKVSQNNLLIEFELVSSLDQEGVRIPRGMCFRNICLQSYRRFSSGVFDYTKASCPYAENTYFTANGLATTNPAEDRCGKHLSDCIKRFGNQQLPFRGTPGIG